jgi:hypothetical protein
LHRASHGLRLLERGLLPLLTTCYGPINDWTRLWQVLGADPLRHRQRLPWYDGFDLALPLANAADELTALAAQLRGTFAVVGVRLEGLQARAIFPEQFNALIAECGTKSTALSRSSLQLLAEVLPDTANEDIRVVCDKHGGRNRYGPLLQQQFPDWLIEIASESRTESVYRWGPASARTELRFRRGGEDFLPVALASMAAKYLRELAMRAENEFWCRRVAGLRPTAGYPVDARRFKAAIAECQTRLAIDDRILWRVR